MGPSCILLGRLQAFSPEFYPVVALWECVVIERLTTEMHVLLKWISSNTMEVSNKISNAASQCEKVPSL